MLLCQCEVFVHNSLHMASNFERPSTELAVGVARCFSVITADNEVVYMVIIALVPAHLGLADDFLLGQFTPLIVCTGHLDELRLEDFGLSLGSDDVYFVKSDVLYICYLLLRNEDGVSDVRDLKTCFSLVDLRRELLDLVRLGELLDLWGACCVLLRRVKQVIFARLMNLVEI